VINLPQTARVTTGEKLNVTFGVLAPKQLGTYEMGWRMQQIGGPLFGPELATQFSVTSSASRGENYR